MATDKKEKKAKTTKTETKDIAKQITDSHEETKKQIMELKEEVSGMTKAIHQLLSAVFHEELACSEGKHKREESDLATTSKKPRTTTDADATKTTEVNTNNAECTMRTTNPAETAHWQRYQSLAFFNEVFKMDPAKHKAKSPEDVLKNSNNFCNNAIVQGIITQHHKETYEFSDNLDNNENMTIMLNQQKLFSVLTHQGGYPYFYQPDRLRAIFSEKSLKGILPFEDEKLLERHMHDFCQERADTIRLRYGDQECNVSMFGVDESTRLQQKDIENYEAVYGGWIIEHVLYMWMIVPESRKDILMHMCTTEEFPTKDMNLIMYDKNPGYAFVKFNLVVDWRAQSL